MANTNVELVISSKDPHGLNRPSLPVAYPLLLLEMLSERGHSTEQVASDSGIAAHVLAKPEGRISLTQWTRLALHAIRLSGEQGLGIEYGLRLKPSAHGFLGYAAMTAPTLRQAITLATQYFRMRLQSYHLHLAEDGERAVLEISQAHPIPVLRSFFFECLLVSMKQLPASFIGEKAEEVELWFDWPEPAYFARYRDRLPPTRFSQPANQLRFPRRYLERQPMLADDSAHGQAIAQVAREYASVRSEDENLVPKVRAALMLGDTSYPSLDELAERLHISSRTLRRKLDLQGASYQALLDEARQRDARQLLESSALDIQTISSRLGFLNPPSFTRAFRKWTGESPSQYRLRCLNVKN
ncbi:AraC family transcriptional regulator [Stenotrophobium rhamnosiphilum]|uniref:AraC family transcriptional regulator n=1 Tax=Stenotrophobium rhamnosiphilum TaxID=2029166 RepID=A0A2T5MKN5_9GAMM|nr:AraC family transcriptional regulator [Stenotrophobium rhamnosiphilum]PTU33118.1 AraC family transcriptional regulator [Stenotrophobium rhamnosiphilum]